ncbi:amidohydrolase family protein [Shumkonia mesophila]|uniref:amidohydrolase family protein n=1 Tax=Shumkonia mesophila TaxID=2838854 RepID=UPI0029351061|nr:amidohydrolase family protein [Shumkonia mesophila]
MNEEWLSLNRENVIEPELGIIDAHHHFWDRPGFRYMLDDFLADVSTGHNIVGSVFVEASSRQRSCVGTMYRADGPEELRSLGEVEFVNGLAAIAHSGQYGPSGLCAGIISYVDLRLAESVVDVLAEHARMPRVKGIRNMTAWHAEQAIRSPDLVTNPGMLGEPAFRRGFAALHEFGFSFDAWLFVPQIPELTKLARSFPDVKIVLDHLSGVMGAGPYAGRRNEAIVEWRSNLAELARCPNAYVKIGGMASPRGGFDLDGRAVPADSDELARHWRPYVETCIELFGTRRCMFESNFPVDKQWVSYVSLWNAFKKITREFSASERRDLFFDTAKEFYSLELPEP